MRISIKNRLQTASRALLMLCAMLPGMCITAQPADTPYLAGIHWYHSDPASGDVEAMTGGHAVWVVDQALLDSNATVAAGNPWETPWVTSPTSDKSQPYYKPGYMEAVVAKGHTAIMRLHPFWGVNSPYPGDPYTVVDFANDCKVTAQLMTNVHVWQIGNEANLNGENMRWNEATNRYDLPWPAADLTQAPERYAATYIACREKIHEVVPQTTPAAQVVLMQPCSPGDPIAGTRFMSSDEFLARMIRAVPDKSKIDGFALHAYAQPGGADYGALGYMNDLRRQIAIIDQAGLGDRPIFITEFNKHMPNSTEAASGAKFINSAFQRMNAWNTGAPALWPGQMNHPLRGAAWFVYRGGAGWDDYALQHWKTAIASTQPDTNPWYAYQAAFAQEYPAGAGAGPLFTQTSVWWSDSFANAGLDALYPLPAWEVGKAAGTAVTASAGEARIAATSAFQVAGIRHSQIPFVDFSMEVEVSFTDVAAVAAGEANVDLRFRQAGADGPGFSLTFYSSQSAVRPGEVWLRKTAFWDTTYKSGVVAGGISTGDAFNVQIIAEGPRISVRVLRQPDDAMVLDWTGANAVQIADHHVGGMGIYTYNLREARVQDVRMGGVGMITVSSDVGEWQLYE